VRRHRIEQGYFEKLRSLLRRAGVRRLDAGWLLERARRESARGGRPLEQVLAAVYDRTRRQVAARLGAPGAAPAEAAPRFLCDGGLGALARWLRAAGYEAAWAADTAGDSLVERARAEGCVLVTIDHRVLERRGVRDGAVRAVWLPAHLTRFEKLAMLLRELGLEPREARCMACGSRLDAVAKRDVLERIPPRTARWKDAYFVCAGCGRLYWQGTHWDRIASRLEAAAGGGSR
jgi:uncharacterized protein with PIN domain